jgi:predicted pyridoxine 5'-phosphate oxidase superfamily flavin-nucleotide-binding protein
MLSDMGVYHRGEIAVQSRAGVRDISAYLEAGIGAMMPPGVHAFLAAQPMLILGAADRDGSVWAGMISGQPGFLSATGQGLLIAGRPATGDPIAGVLAETTVDRPVRVGTIIIDQGERVRLRVNGRAYQVGSGLRVDADQVYGNCPRYIQRRSPTIVDSQVEAAQTGTELTMAQQRLIGDASTFFVATADEQGNADASHRGGKPGFLQVVGPTRLRWPDYAGNSMFMTLGNLEVNPRAGLLVPDWATGTTLHLSGAARVIWDAHEFAGIPGAERLVDFEIRAVVEVPGASPLRWSAPEFSRFNP